VHDLISPKLSGSPSLIPLGCRRLDCRYSAPNSDQHGLYVFFSGVSLALVFAVPNIHKSVYDYAITNFANPAYLLTVPRYVILDHSSPPPSC
jgi:hypothetical protein